jgi:hypothetical protein
MWQATGLEAQALPFTRSALPAPPAVEVAVPKSGPSTAAGAVRAIAAIVTAGAAQESQGSPGKFAGRVAAVDGTAAAGVRIFARSAAEKSETASDVLTLGPASTNGNGRFILEGVPPGRYYIFAAASAAQAETAV